MFADLLDGCVGLSDAALDERVRANELELRALLAEQAALVAVTQARGSYRADGHRSMNGYLRATCNVSTAEAHRRRLVASSCTEATELGDALLAGRVGVDQIREIGRIHRNPRTRECFARVAPIFVAAAEHASHRELKCDIDSFLNLADPDGAFDDLADNVEGRDATIHADTNGVHARVSGGDPVTAEEISRTFEWFVEREFRRDADAAGPGGHLARTDKQRRYDAFVAMVRAARAHGDGAKPADVTVNLVADPHTFNDAFADAGITVADSADTTTDPHTTDIDGDLVAGIVDLVADDPESFLDRRCETSSGIPIHPKLLAQAAMTAYVRRVIVDAQGVVVDMGRRQRLFTGSAREAAKLLARGCTFLGCVVGEQFAQVDHLDEWERHGGPTDQANAAVDCDPHNRFKHRARWRTRRDGTGRVFHIRPDGTLVLPVGAREPDLADDDMIRAARARAAALRPDAA